MKKLRAMQTDPARVRRTDPGDPEKCPVWDLHKIYSDEATRQWAASGCRSAGIGCLECKQPLIDKVVEEISGMRKRAQEFEDNPELVRGIVAEGADKAREAARQTLDGGQARHAPACRLNPVKPRPQLKIVVSNEPLPAAVVPQPEQVEMPFAVVNGEPISQMPRDLYIPPQALEVFLEAFEGPLDLLLYLIRRQNLDILDIPLAEITRQYMQYIELMQDLQLELAGEYLVMAATLAEIKSRMLLPRPKLSEEGELDPRAELVRRLQEYERFKRAAEGIDQLARLERDVWPASAPLKERQVVRALPQLTLQEMLLAFKDVVARSQMFAHHHIQRERLSVGERMSDILARLGHERLPALHGAVSARGGAHGRHGHLRRHPRADARGADRHRADRALRAAARARGRTAAAPRGR